jgi:Cu2+-exporting ATPase
MTDDHAHHGHHETPDAMQTPASMHPPAEPPPSGPHAGGHGHDAMLADFRRRFVVSLVLTIPILALTPEVQQLAGVELTFPGQELAVL